MSVQGFSFTCQQLRTHGLLSHRVFLGHILWKKCIFFPTDQQLGYSYSNGQRTETSATTMLAAHEAVI